MVVDGGLFREAEGRVAELDVGNTYEVGAVCYVLCAMCVQCAVC